MTAFWKNLHQLAAGQLFNGGYLTEKTVAPGAAQSGKQTRASSLRERSASQRPAHGQIAACR